MNEIQVNWGNEFSFVNTIKLFAKHLLLCDSDSQVPIILKYHNQHLFNIQLVGFVVHEIQREQYKIFLIDDGTGLVECQVSDNVYYQYFSDEIKFIGKVVNVIGFATVSPFSRVFQTIEGEGEMSTVILVVSSLHVVEDANEEYLHWMEVIQNENKYFSK